MLVNICILILAFILLDRHFVKLEDRQSLEQELKAEKRVPLTISGWHNFIFIGLIIAGVILNGLIPQSEAFISTDTGKTYGFDVFGTHVGVEYIIQLGFILVAMLLSWITTSKSLRRHNNFEWGPIAEVAKLFIGIFITMIPALALLRAYGGTLGIDSPLTFFWSTGALSSFLDNSPTYVVFLTTAGALGSSAADAVITTVGSVDPSILLAISAGAVFMGAITYIGNAPNFMVKSIAEGNGVKMPSFFGYIGWSLCFLIPVFIIDTLLFFL